MRKLLLFVMVLFGILSVQSFAWNYGCGENIPPDVCGADGSKSGGGGSMTNDPYIGAIAFNKDTGAWASVSNMQGKKEAKADVLSRCGQNCEVIMVDWKRCVGLAYLASDKIYGSDSAMDQIYTGAGYNTRVKRANEKALKKCEKNGGQNCKVIVNVCAVEGTTKY